MNRRMTWVMVMTAICATGHATAMLPAMTEEEAAESADLVARAKVIAVEHRDGDGGSREPGTVITIEILTKGVSVKQRATVFWSQTLADASMARPRPPLVGQTCRVYLRSGWAQSDFELVHPDWGFVPVKAGEEETAPAFIEHRVKRGDTLYALALHYYGKGQRWRVLKVANFEKEAEGGVYPLRPGMVLHVPTFPMKVDKK